MSDIIHLLCRMTVKQRVVIFFLSKDSTSTKNQIYYLSITFPQFKGQLHFWKLQFEALYCSRSACLHFSPQSQIISLMGHALSWAGWVLRFTVWLHWRQTTSISPHFSICSLAMSSCTLSWQARRLPGPSLAIASHRYSGKVLVLFGGTAGKELALIFL